MCLSNVFYLVAPGMLPFLESTEQIANLLDISVQVFYYCINFMILILFRVLPHVFEMERNEPSKKVGIRWKAFKQFAGRCGGTYFTISFRCFLWLYKMYLVILKFRLYPLFYIML